MSAFSGGVARIVPGIRRILGIPARFFGSAVCRRILYLVLLGLLAFLDYRGRGLARATYVFYDIESGNELVEERLLPLPPDREGKLRFYTAEALLGPVSPNAQPLFPRGTRLESLLFRDMTVYLDLSETAALPVDGEGSFRSLSALGKGIMRNFSFVKDVRFFIAGREAFPEKFRQE
ncbi:MAG: GerMN domain-containing protein [Spirochaetaceae bacterium]|jgi:hypothetical protein|nr:GerMN domain-containing protein [Spirochaetaceae bacterium]